MGPLGSHCHRQRAPTVAQVRARGGPLPGFRKNSLGSRIWKLPLMGPGSPLTSWRLPSQALLCPGSQVSRGGCQEARGLLADLLRVLPCPALPQLHSQMCLPHPQPRSHAAAVLRPHQHQIVTSVTFCQPLHSPGWECGPVQITSWAQRGGGQCPGPHSPLVGWRVRGWGREESVHSCLAGLRGWGPWRELPKLLPNVAHLLPLSRPASLLPRLPVQGAPPPDSL